MKRLVSGLGIVLGLALIGFGALLTFSFWFSDAPPNYDKRPLYLLAGALCVAGLVTMGIFACRGKQ